MHIQLQLSVIIVVLMLMFKTVKLAVFFGTMDYRLQSSLIHFQLQLHDVTI